MIRIDDTLQVWKEQGAVHVRIVEVDADPVELTVDQARELASALVKLCDEVDAEDAPNPLEPR